MKPSVLRYFLVVVFALVLVSASRAEVADKKPNVLLLCIDDLRPELNCFGKEYIHSPNVDALAERGRAFHSHYVQAPTCGASRYTLLTGRYGAPGNGAIFARAARLREDPDSDPPSMPAWFRQHGYTTVSVGKVSHHPGGRGGKDWNDGLQPEMPNSWDRHLMPCGPWQHPRGAMHGLANGEIRIKAEEMDVYQTFDGPDVAYPDGLTVEESLRQLDALTGENGSGKPFFLAVGIIRPHLPFGAPEKYLAHYRDATLPVIPHPNKPVGKTTWHRSGEFMKYNRWKRDPNDDPEFATLVRKHYAASVTYADAQVGRIIAKLESLNLRDDTIIVLWGDHGWHLGEHAIWGKHALFEESLHSPLIISYSGISKPGVATQSMVETLDVFPTLCDLAKITRPEFAQGVSLRPMLESPDAPGHPAVAYAKARTIRTKTHRLILHKDGYAELYDHRSPEKETKNVAMENPDIVKEMTAALDMKMLTDIE